MTTPWPHQVKGLDMARAEFRRGAKWVCVVMATGAGKTVFGGMVCEQHLRKKPDGKVLWLAHREELVSQAFDALTAAGLSCGVIQANPTREVNPHRPVQIASIQTLVARNILLSGITLLVYDEVHHSMSAGWNKYSSQYKASGALGIGLTATPVRADGLPLGDLFDGIVCPITMKELIEQGFLVPYELIRPRKPLRPKQLAQRPVDAWLTNAKGHRTVVFAANVVSATLFRDQFREAGVDCEMVHGMMDAGSRRDVLQRYKSGKFPVLLNVGILTEGFDDPPTSCVMLARGVGSISLYLQICGRALRTSLKTGKSHAILIDLHGASHRHDVPDADREYTLDGDGIRSKNQPAGPERFCALCGCTLEADATICPDCGSEKSSTIPPEIVNAELVKYAAKRKEGEEKRASTLARWLQDARTANHKEGRALHKYKSVYGDWPPRDVLSEAKRISRIVTDKLDTGRSMSHIET